MYILCIFYASVNVRNNQISWQPSCWELTLLTEIRKKHTENFIVGFDRLLRLAKECDTDNIISDTLVYSAHGLLNIRMRDYHPDRKFERIYSTNTDDYLEQFTTTCLEQKSDWTSL